MRVIVNRGLDGKFQKLSQLAEGYREAYGSRMAAQLTIESPVDTGTYMDNFYAEGSGTVGTPSSKGKPRNQPWSDRGATERMATAVAQSTGSVLDFGNAADHALDVENKHGYAPFAKAKREHKRIAQAAALDAKKKAGL